MSVPATVIVQQTSNQAVQVVAPTPVTQQTVTNAAQQVTQSPTSATLSTVVDVAQVSDAPRTVVANVPGVAGPPGAPGAPGQAFFTLDRYEFTATATNTTPYVVTMPHTIGGYTYLALNGVRQPPASYTVAGTQLTLPTGMLFASADVYFECSY